MRRRTAIVLVALPLLAMGGMATFEPYPSLFDAQYVGSANCGTCHTQVYEKWRNSPHALMARPATPSSVVGDFGDVEWSIPPAARKAPHDDKPVRCYRRGDEYFMALWHGGEGRQVEFKIDYVVGYQYRQTYLTREKGGVLRRLPLEWSPGLKKWFPYWSHQEGSEPDLLDLWAQMNAPNSAWNLFCARCHTTHLEVLDKDELHTRADARWVEPGIACEACHGPGSHHSRYFEKNYVNRIAAFVKSKVRGEPVAFMANAPKLDKGQDLSICARCHGADIMQDSQDIYRQFEPGYSRSGRMNDLSVHFQEFPLQPGRKVPTVECWDDGRPRGIGMLFRSFVESTCYQKGEPRCYDCHDPHDNKQARAPGLLEATDASDEYCLKCHQGIRERLSLHTHHAEGQPGSFCYDCHMPKHIDNQAGGFLRPVRTHDMSSVPDPAATKKHGAGAPNACNDCHRDRDPDWASSKMAEWWPAKR